MFGNNKDTQKKSDSVHRLLDGGIANRVNKGTTLEGEINSETDIRIEGRIKGIINCKAKVVIGESGEFEGNIVCKEAAIEGNVKGKLQVNGLLYLKKTSKFKGDLIYKKLIVEEGAVIVGNVSMEGKAETSSRIDTKAIPLPKKPPVGEHA